jgi:hypothetical protein
MRPTLKLKKPVAAPVAAPIVKAPKKLTPQAEKAKRHLENSQLNAEAFARRKAQIEKVKPLVYAYFAENLIFHQTVFVDGVECLRPLAVGVRKIIFAFFKTQPEFQDCTNTVINDLISEVLGEHTRNPKYLLGLLKLNNRFDLEGNVFSPITPIHKLKAEKIIAACST